MKNLRLRGLGAALSVVLAAACSAESAEPTGTSTQYLDQILVNGNPLNSAEARWVRFVASDVVPHLDGSRDDQLTVASRVAWWSLKEGVFDVDDPLTYSNCNTTYGDVRLGAFGICDAGRAWQVGLSGVQVTGRDVGSLEAIAQRLYPGSSANDVLADTARQAGVDAGTTAASAGSLRASWLLRNSAVGFTVQAPTITSECIDASYGWCYGTGWDTSRAYAPTRAGALTAIADLRAVLAELAGGGGGAETCGQLASRLGWGNPQCEQASSSNTSSRVACNGTGRATADCSRCCNGDSVGPSHTDESCGAYAARVGLAAPLCEIGGNGACAGSGPSTGDGCLHCCETP